MDSLARVERWIAEVIAGSQVPEDPVHSRNTLDWLLRFDPEADPALRIAALGHDIERAVESRKETVGSPSGRGRWPRASPGAARSSTI